MTRTKQEVINDICDLVGIDSWKVSTGSTEPKGFLLEVADSLGLASGRTDSKPTLARKIIEAGGETWLPTYESDGATVTRMGLESIEESVRKLLEL